MDLRPARLLPGGIEVRIDELSRRPPLPTLDPRLQYLHGFPWSTEPSQQTCLPKCENVVFLRMRSPCVQYDIQSSPIVLLAIQGEHSSRYLLEGHINSLQTAPIEPPRPPSEVADRGQVNEGSDSAQECCYVPLDLSAFDCWPTTITPVVEEWELPALHAAMTVAGLGTAKYELIQSARDRAHFRLPAEELHVLVTPRGREETVSHELAFSLWAHGLGLPVVAPDERVTAQPVVTEEGVASFWPLHQPVSIAELDYEWLGHTLRQLHQQVAQPPSSRWDPAHGIEVALRRLRRAPRVAQHIVAELASEARSALSQVYELTQGQPLVPVHGDAVPDNVVMSPNGLLLVDFEMSGIGSAGYDLAPTQMLARRFGLASEATTRVLRGYGQIIGDDVNEAMIRLYEIVVTCGAIAPYAPTQPLFQEELARRVESMRGGNDRKWTPHVHLLHRTEGLT